MIDSETGFEIQPERYEKIEAANRNSFFMNEAPNLRVIQSLHSAGPSRELFGRVGEASELLDQAGRRARVILAGNLSPISAYGPSHLSPEERVDDAKANLGNFFEQNEISRERIRVLLPERDYTTPLSVVNLDQAELDRDDANLLRPTQRGDFMYTYDRTLALLARPADCPIELVTAMTPKGEVTALVHLAWLGVTRDYIDQAKIVFDGLGVDWDTVRVQVTPGGHSETFRFTNADRYGDPRKTFPGYKSMFKGVKKSVAEDGRAVYDFGIDLAAEVYYRTIESWGIDPYQIYLNTTDTTAPHVGHSSNSRAFQEYAVDGDNTRDGVVAWRE